VNQLSANRFSRGIMAHFGVGETKASLGLALYVIGCTPNLITITPFPLLMTREDGLGPLIFAPMSEIPIFGRSVPYIATLTFYLLFTLGAALVDSFGGLMCLRFLQGFFSSPYLANGGASMQDMVCLISSSTYLLKANEAQYSMLYLPYAMCFWVAGIFAAPALGPVLSGFSVVAEGYIKLP
jgi:DHA1 family multidrug resistance protein-like MFS transporter